MRPTYSDMLLLCTPFRPQYVGEFPCFRRLNYTRGHKESHVFASTLAMLRRRSFVYCVAFAMWLLWLCEYRARRTWGDLPPLYARYGLKITFFLNYYIVNFEMNWINEKFSSCWQKWEMLSLKPRPNNSWCLNMYGFNMRLYRWLINAAINSENEIPRQSTTSVSSSIMAGYHRPYREPRASHAGHEQLPRELRMVFRAAIALTKYVKPNWCMAAGAICL